MGTTEEQNFRRVVVGTPPCSSAVPASTTATAPRDYVEGMFDIYATKFEGILVDNLGYKIPEAIARIIIADSDLKLLGSITDLGCGTGLFGAEIKKEFS